MGKALSATRSYQPPQPGRPGRAVPGSRTGLGDVWKPRGPAGPCCALTPGGPTLGTRGDRSPERMRPALSRGSVPAAAKRQTPDAFLISHGQVQQANSGRRSQAERRLDPNSPSPCSSQNQDQKSSPEGDTDEKDVPFLGQTTEGLGEQPTALTPRPRLAGACVLLAALAVVTQVGRAVTAVHAPGEDRRA